MNAIARTIMLIDDDSVDQMVYRRVIGRTGLFEKVIPFSLATEALEFLKANPDEQIDLILLDINMPRMNGFEFLEASRAVLPKGLSGKVVIMLTTSLDPKDVERAGTFDEIFQYINKPLTEAALREVTDELWTENA